LKDKRITLSALIKAAKKKRILTLGTPRTFQRMKTTWLKKSSDRFNAMWPVYQPHSPFKIMWSQIMIVFIVYECFAIPVDVCFDFSPGGLMFIFNSVINVYFIMDIVLNFMTGYSDENGKVVLIPSRVVANYTQGWLALDVIASIPWDWLTVPDSSVQMTKGLRFARILRMSRAMRLRKLATQDFALTRMGALEDSVTFQLLSGMFRVLFLLFSITHWAACMWYTIGRMGSRGQNWVDKYLPVQADQTRENLYLHSVYFILTTMTTVGYGDMTPQNDIEVLFSLFLLAVASVTFAALMGSLTDLIASVKSSEHERSEKRKELMRYLRWRKVPVTTMVKVEHHMRHKWDANEVFEDYEEEVKQQLSPGLRNELCYHIYGKVLRRLPFLAWMRGFEDCYTRLAASISSMFLSPGDFIFRQGQPGDTVYMLLKGSVRLTLNHRVASQELSFSRSLAQTMRIEGHEGEQSDDDANPSQLFLVFNCPYFGEVIGS